MKLIKLIISYLIGAATIIGFGITVYFQFIHKDVVEIEIKSIDKIQLTKDSNIEDLTIKYLYQDSVEVNNLWKIRYVISNVGTKTIIAKGDNKNILYENLSVAIKDSIKIFSINIDQKNFPISILKEDSNIVTLDFKQWKSTEYIDVIAIVENLGKTDPFISIDERDIVDSKITYSEYKPTEINSNRKLIEYLPEGFANFLKWAIVAIIFIMDIIAIWAINKQLKEDTNNSGKTTKIVTFIIWLIMTVIFSVPLLWIF